MSTSQIVYAISLRCLGESEGGILLDLESRLCVQQNVSLAKNILAI